MMWGDGMGWGDWVVMTLALVAFWSVVVFGVIAIFRGTSGRGSDSPASDEDPLRILDQRFARGDIDADEYHARRNALRAVRSS